MQQPHFLKVFRPVNLFFLFILQSLTYYFLDFNAHWTIFKNPHFWLLASATICIAAAGYLINDYYDQIADEHNKPNNRPILNWSAASVKIAYMLLNLAALTMAYGLGMRWVILFVFIISGLWSYSFFLKRLPLMGNLLIAAFAFISVYIVYDVFRVQNPAFIFFYSTLAGLFTLLREMAKDIEDIPGDRMAEYQTLPVLVGFTGSKSFLLAMTGFVAVLYTSFQYQWVGHFFTGKLLLVFVVYQLVCILLPLLVLIFWLFSARNSFNMTRISKMFKYLMATGMLSMAFF